MHKQFKKKISFLWKLGRYNKPEGALLLFWPCVWGLFLSSEFTIIKLKFLVLFFIGAFVMRGAGCTINDIVDVKIDRRVQRTKSRPLASRKISKSTAFFFLIFQLFLGLLVVVNLSPTAIFLSFVIIPFVFLYPFTKRFTNFPQIILGLIFNWGILISYYEINNTLDLNVLFIYIFGVLLTIGYDTIYGFQDFADDMKISVKSLSIKIKDEPKKYITYIYTVAVFFLFVSLNLTNFSKILLYLILIFVVTHFFFQIKSINIKDKIVLRKIFLSNVSLGFFLSIIFFFNNLLINL